MAFLKLSTNDEDELFLAFNEKKKILFFVGDVTEAKDFNQEQIDLFKQFLDIICSKSHDANNIELKSVDRQTIITEFKDKRAEHERSIKWYDEKLEALKGK